ncbi:uncharacterized protein FRV6_15463 [Fusarium oxysporum]|uniref:Uncharacterized protein n=1 Tax=Fusarium oxysporum TaxID=5507 RepID=A0A2H3TUJ0_FUSOX|nr:uncharacterized protein FRV6_15463 [Fusarium oxysporum]
MVNKPSKHLNYYLIGPYIMPSLSAYTTAPNA